MISKINLINISYQGSIVLLSLMNFSCNKTWHIIWNFDHGSKPRKYFFKVKFENKKISIEKFALRKLIASTMGAKSWTPLDTSLLHILNSSHAIEHLKLVYFFFRGFRFFPIIVCAYSLFVKKVLTCYLMWDFSCLGKRA